MPILPNIDIHGVFIDPTTIADLNFAKRNSIVCQVFQETKYKNGVHILKYVGNRTYGVVLQDTEHPDPSNYVMNYRDAVINRILKKAGQAGKITLGHITERLKIDESGDKYYNILKTDRTMKETLIRNIPAIAYLLNGQKVSIYSNTPNYDFNGATPYAQEANNDVCVLTIKTKQAVYVLFGSEIDATNEQLEQDYEQLKYIFNQLHTKQSSSKPPLLSGLKQINLGKAIKIEINLPGKKSESLTLPGNVENFSEKTER